MQLPSTCSLVLVQFSSYKAKRKTRVRASQTVLMCFFRYQPLFADVLLGGEGGSPRQTRPCLSYTVVHPSLSCHPFFLMARFQNCAKNNNTKQSPGFVLQPGKRLKRNTRHVTRPADCCRPRHGDFRKPIGQSVRPGFQSSSA